MNMYKNGLVALLLTAALLFLSSCVTHTAPSQLRPALLKALIIDGQNNHIVWPKSTLMMKQMLEASGRFSVDVQRTRYVWKSERFLADYPLLNHNAVPVEQPKSDPEFSPDFSQYDVVISNFGWRAADWPKSTQLAFEEFVNNGGGFVTVHAANNAFGSWPAYNQIIGLGGWGGRNEKSGPYLYVADNNQIVQDTSPGAAGGHGKQHPFTIDNRDPTHPIMQNLPASWPHVRDELYNRLRGPAENVNLLATAYDSPEQGGFGRHEPVLMTISYGEGRVFHTTLGHGAKVYESDSFIVTFVRGTEWAASGRVTTFKNGFSVTKQQ